MKKTSRSKKINSRKYKRRRDRRVSEWVKKYHRSLTTERIKWITGEDCLKTSRITKYTKI